MRRYSLRTLVFATLLTPVGAYAAADANTKSMPGMNCPMMGQMTAMQKDMSGLMGDMDKMMKDTSDPAGKARMQMMREHMTAMMANMQMMGGMMGAPATPSGEKGAAPPPSVAAPADENHDAHHPAK